MYPTLLEEILRGVEKSPTLSEIVDSEKWSDAASLIAMVNNTDPENSYSKHNGAQRSVAPHNSSQHARCGGGRNVTYCLFGSVSDLFLFFQQESDY